MGMGGGGGGGGEEEAVGSFPSGSEEKRLRPGVGNEATIAMDYLFKRLDYREMERFFLGFVICCCDLRSGYYYIKILYILKIRLKLGPFILFFQLIIFFHLKKNKMNKREIDEAVIKKI